MNEASGGEVTVKCQRFAKSWLARHVEARGVHEGLVAFVVFTESSPGCVTSCW